MPKPKTSEQLQQEFQKLKEKKQREKQKQSQLKKQKRLEEYKTINKALKEAKKQRAEQLINQLKKFAPEPPKREITNSGWELHIYNNPLIEKEPDEKELYTKYELQHIEELYPEETGRINWKVWDKILTKKLYIPSEE